MTRVAPEDGRVGDIWRVEGKDHEMVVDRLTKHTITLNSVNEPQASSWGYDLDGWDDALYRIREDLTGVAVGDRVHLHIPETEVYLVKVTIDTQWPSLSGWFGFQTGRQPEPDADDEGLFFHRRPTKTLSWNDSSDLSRCSNQEHRSSMPGVGRGRSRRRSNSLTRMVSTESRSGH